MYVVQCGRIFVFFFSSSQAEVSSTPRTLDVWMITGLAGSPTVATMAAPPAIVPPVAEPSVFIVTGAFASCFHCKLMFVGISF